MIPLQMGKRYERKDAEYRLAKKMGVRSRAYCKLEEIQQRYHLLKPGQSVADLGAWPGSWLEYSIKMIGKSGLLVGIDLTAVDPLPDDNVHLIHGDLADENNIEAMIALCPAGYDLVLSDLSPKLNGIKESDNARTGAIAELALYAAARISKTNSNLVIKVFKNSETDQLINQSRRFFGSLKRVRLETTRRSSDEHYLLGLGFKTEEYLDNL